MKPRQWVGLTGGIASGKSTVAKILRDLGFSVLDADQISTELRAPGGAAHGLILKKFGTVDRLELRSRIFKSAEDKAALEGILHPLIQVESQRLKDSLVQSGARLPILYEAALLVETGRAQDLDGLIVVTAPLDLRIKRLVVRDQITSEQATQILAAQTSDQARLAAADWVIENAGTLDELKQKVASQLTQALLGNSTLEIS
jgi:dephospho-CoA kinase